MFNQKLKDESMRNIAKLTMSCDKKCKKEQASDLKRYYMNKYGGYMTAKIVSVVLTEFLMMLMISVNGLDRLWHWLDYGEFIVYSILWGAGGIYLAQMLIKIVIRTYNLKCALDAGEVLESSCRITFHGHEGAGKKTKMNFYVKARRKQEPLWILKKPHGFNIESNVEYNEKPGTELIIYTVNDKRSDVFIMVKGRKIRESPDKILAEMWRTSMFMNKVRLGYIKGNIRKMFKRK